jgi:hypothetical protein
VIKNVRIGINFLYIFLMNEWVDGKMQVFWERDVKN